MALAVLLVSSCLCAMAEGSKTTFGGRRLQRVRLGGAVTRTGCINAEESCTAVHQEQAITVCCLKDGGIADMGGCTDNVTYQDAIDICDEQDYRLCSQDELASGCPSATSCHFDGGRVWTSTRCSLAPALIHTKVNSFSDREEKNYNGTTGNRAVAKVTELLKELLDQLNEDAKADKDQFDKYKTWYTEKSKETTEVISKTSGQIASLQSSLQSQEAFRKGKGLNLDTYGNNLVKVENTLKDAAAKRAKEKKTFASSEAEYVTAVDQLTRSLVVMGKKAPDGKAAASAASMLDVAKKVRGVLLQGPDFSLSPLQRETVNGFLRAVARHRLPSGSASTDAGDSSEDEEAPVDFLQTESSEVGPYGDYASQSGGVTSALQSVLEKAKANLKSLRDAETKNAASWKEYSAGIEDQIKSFKKSMTTIKGEISESEETSGKDKVKLLSAQNLLKVNKEALVKVEAAFKERTEAFNMRTKSRSDEILAVTEAKKIMGSKEMQKYLPENWSGSFVQRSSPVDSFLQLKEQNSQHRRPSGLSLLGMKSRVRRRSLMRMDADPFEKVKGLMRDMISRLKAQNEADATQAGWCNRETDRTTKSKDDTTQEVEKLKAKIAEIDADLAQLVQDLKTITEDSADTQKAANEATTLRNKERAEAVASIIRYKDAQRMLKAATAALQKVYKAKQGGSALLQDDPPANKVTYERSDMGAGVVGILEIAIQDFFQLQGQTEAAEKQAQKEYKELMDSTEVQMAAMKKDLEYKGQAKVKLEGDRMRRKSFMTMRVKELEALAKYLAQLEAQCVKTDSYEKRKARREKELASLKECLKALGGGD